MIEFVNLKDGRVFNGDKPYVFWFENGQSVNLNYVRKICFISTSRVVEARVDSPVFSLMVMGQDIPIQNTPDKKAEIINEKLYMNLEDLKSNFYTSVGYPYNNFYVHIIYILANSQEAGEIHDYLILTDTDGDHTYEIAADFYGDNEVLKTNLSNFDVHIPESIQKAIYDINVHEEANDNITLNRKYKELLMNYWDIIANKGSYNSLQNSLAWFEWGDLVRIEELWKRHHEGMEEYFHTKLNKDLDYEFITEFLNNTKTTYVGLYMALSRLQIIDGKVQYQNDIPSPEATGNVIYPEDNPLLVETITKWQLIDLCLKMTLLGNFYSTYFVPIHINVIHSTLEHWVFAYTIKVLQAANVNIVNVVNNIRPFDLVCDKKVKMMAYQCRNYSDTLFLSSGNVFGYEDTIRREMNTKFQTTGEFIKYHMGGTYGVVNFKVMEDNPILAGDQNDRIWHERLTWISEDDSGDIESHVSIEPVHMERDGHLLSQWVFLLDFNIGFMNPGKYKLAFQFDTLYGNTWTKTIEVEIEDTTRNHIDLFKVIKRDDTDTLEFTSSTPEVWLKSFQVNPGIDVESSFEEIDTSTYNYVPYMEQSIFLNQFISNDVDVNHTVIFDIPDGIDYDFDPRYIWITSKPDDFNFTRAIGICREFGVNPEHGTLEIEDITIHGQANDPVMSYRFHPIMHKLVPLGDDMEINQNELIYVVPQLGHSRNITSTNWIFTNATTGEQYDSSLILKHYHEYSESYGEYDIPVGYGGMMGHFIAPRTQVSLKPGYYDIKFQYLKGDTIQEYNVKSAFLMRK